MGAGVRSGDEEGLWVGDEVLHSELEAQTFTPTLEGKNRQD